MQCLFERFKNENLFLREFWSACEFICTLRERDSHRKVSLEALNSLERGIKSIVKVKLAEKDKLAYMSDNFTGEFCEEVNENTLKIKKLALTLLNELIDHLFKV